MRVSREIIRLAVPAIISNITTPLLGLADTAVTGHMGGAAFVGAIAVGGSMFSLAYWPLNFLRMGTSGLTSQAYGKSERGDAGSEHPGMWLWRALAVAAALSAALLLSSPLIAKGLLAFLDADAQVSALAARYFMIVVCGAPAVLGSYAISGWMLGMQDSRGPMWMALLTNIGNIALSVIFVFGCRMGIAGVALGTLAAQWMGLALGVALAMRKLPAELRAPRLLLALRGGQMRRFFSVNADIFLRTLCLAAVTLWFTRGGAGQGELILAANALLMQLFILFSYFMDGFAFAGEALAGRCAGAADHAALRAVVRGVFAWGLALALAFTAAYALAGDAAISLLTDDRQIAEAASAYMPWAVAVPLAGVAAFAWDGIFVGLTLTRQMLVSMAAATAAFFILGRALPASWGNHALWAAFIAYLAIRGLAQTALWAVRKGRS